MSKEEKEKLRKSDKNRKIIKIGIIGCGGIAQNHAFSISLLENNARKIWKWKESSQKIKPILYALADIDGNKADEFAKHFPAKKIYKGPKSGYDLISDPEIDAVLNTLKARKNTILLDADTVAKDLGSSRSSNIVILGAASPYIDLPYEALEEAIKEIFLRKGDKVIEANINALKAGREFAEKQ